MNTVLKTKQYTIGGIRFNINLLCPLFNFDNKSGSLHFLSPDAEKNTNWTINFDYIDNLDSHKFVNLFTGSDKFDFEIPYKWSVVNTGKSEGIYVEFEDHTHIKEALAEIDKENKSVWVNLCLHKEKNIPIDPFLHPLGILILQYIVHFYGGFIIHASAVEHNNNGYLFSAVSGTGKSTMAGLWRQKGATIINDDRLIILPDEDDFSVWNTPMPYYQDTCKSVKLHKAFLIKQSADNYIKQLPILHGTLGLLGNCMQFQYDAQQVQNRLERIQSIAETCGIYECGFKPDDEIVELILNQFD